MYIYIYIYIYIYVCVCVCVRARVPYGVVRNLPHNNFQLLESSRKETLGMSGDISLGSPVYCSSSVFAHFYIGSEMH